MAHGSFHVTQRNLPVYTVSPEHTVSTSHVPTVSSVPQGCRPNYHFTFCLNACWYSASTVPKTNPSECMLHKDEIPEGRAGAYQKMKARKIKTFTEQGEYNQSIL